MASFNTKTKKRQTKLTFNTPTGSSTAKAATTDDVASDSTHLPQWAKRLKMFRLKSVTGSTGEYKYEMACLLCLHDPVNADVKNKDSFTIKDKCISAFKRHLKVTNK
jgi:hypothetical protein